LINSFHIKNYRGFREFTIQPLERVNLVTGSNNVGKTALLEALYLNLAPGMALHTNLDSHSKAESSTWLNLFRGFKDVAFSLDNLSKWGWLFYGKDIRQDIELISRRSPHHAQVVRLFWRVENKNEGAPIPKGVSLEDLLVFLGVKFQNNGGEQFFWKILKSGGHQPPQNPRALDSAPLRLLFNSSSRPSEEVTKWFSTLADLGRQDEIVETLRLIDPRLKNLAVSTSDGPAMVYGDIGVGRRIPISQMGEGMVRLLTLVLEIANAAGGVVLVDEIENGLHYSVMGKVWTAIAGAARQSDTQIIATTHSFECIRAAHAAFHGRDKYDLRLHRLDRIENEIRATTYDEDTLSAAIESDFEVR